MNDELYLLIKASERKRELNSAFILLLIFIALMALMVSLMSCSATRTGGDYLSVPAPTKPHAPGPVEMPPKAAKAEYR